MENRALNTDILVQVRKLERSEFKNSVVAGDQALAGLLNVSRQTVINWRKAGKIPFEIMGAKLHVYKMKLVLQALNEMANDDYNARSEAIHKAIDAVIFEDRLNQMFDMATKIGNEKKANKKK